MVQGSFRTQACFWSGLIHRVWDWLRKLAPLFLTNQLLEKLKKNYWLLRVFPRLHIYICTWLDWSMLFVHFCTIPCKEFFGGYVIQKSCMRTYFCYFWKIVFYHTAFSLTLAVQNMWLLIQQQAYAVPRKSWDLAILLIGKLQRSYFQRGRNFGNQSDEKSRT